MSQLYSLSLDAIKYICNLINQTVDLPSTILDDLHIATNTTYSSYKLDALLMALKEENIEYCDAAIAGLNKLSKEIITDKAQITNENTIYLLLTDATKNVYEQWLLINGTPTMIGTTEMNLDNVYTKDEADARYSLLTDFNTLKDGFDALKDEIGTETLSTTSQTVKGAINEVKTSVPTDDDIKSLADGQITVNSVDYVSSYVDESLIPNMSLIKSTYFGSYVPSSTNRTDDPNETTLATIRTKHANCPTDTMEYIIFTIITDKKFGSEVSFNNIAEKKQIAIATANQNDIYVRSHAYDSTTWTKWQKIPTTSVADVPKTYIPCSEPDKFPGIHSGGCTYYVRNSICYVSLWGISSITDGNDIIIPGAILPKSANGSIGAFLTAANSASPTIFAYVEPTGQLCLNIRTANIFCYGSFSYPVAES